MSGSMQKFVCYANVKYLLMVAFHCDVVSGELVQLGIRRDTAT